MGLLSEGSPLSWEKTKELADHVRKHGVIQFINLYHRLKNREGDVLKWGDEVEYIIVTFDHEKKVAQVSLRAPEVLSTLQEKELRDPNNVKSLWRPEYGAYMIEGTPGKPYGGLLAHFNIVEANMRMRRQEATHVLQGNEVLFSLTAFPRLGCPNFSSPSYKPTPSSGASCSLFIPDETIFPGHPRFKTLTRNIRLRRGEKVAINLPVFKDKKTQSPFRDDLRALGDASGDSNGAALPDHVYMDAMGFGMGCCCLQLTFQACNIREARILYDQLTPLCPIMAVYAQLRAADIDHLLAQHVAHLFVRDSVSLFSEKVDQDDHNDTDHFENIQSTNWQTMRFKPPSPPPPPPPPSPLLTRVILSYNINLLIPISKVSHSLPFTFLPFTSHSIAIVCFVVLLTRVILSYNINLLIPISKVDENMVRAQKRNAVNTERFWFRKDVGHESSSESPSDVCTLMTINEIINGKEGVFPGLIPLINNYLGGMDVDADTHCTIQQYLKLIARRASGELLTTASWIRRFVQSHPAYNEDSIVNERINYDLLAQADRIQKGEVTCPELLGHCIISKTHETIPKAVSKNYDCTD
ncbi:hypothetical protein LSTR_LSTR011975 [Laodelphax striatellus]|uniref:Glutamate--cysteine ligase n=1 Tax=Laodelphax striatellus TaxID=195883 RepID=A0A482WW88_LAOST|nr:hypothetical protein LSTR_LSTR011975 [Laodelphax striatellus]